MTRTQTARSGRLGALLGAVLSASAVAAVAGPRFDRVVGTYYQRTGYQDASLVIARDGTFVRNFAANDAGAPPRSEDGTVRLERWELTVSTRRPGSPAQPTESYVVVPWDDWIYLVRPDQLGNFCMDYNRKTLRLGVMPYYVRAGRAEPRGVPDVPGTWREWLLAAPVVARVSAVLEGGDLEIDAGRAEGLQVGMWLGARQPPRSGTYHVIAVEEHRSRVRHTERVTQPPTPVGAVLSTSPS